MRYREIREGFLEKMGLGRAEDLDMSFLVREGQENDVLWHLWNI